MESMLLGKPYFEDALENLSNRLAREQLYAIWLEDTACAPLMWRRISNVQSI